jgi:L-seryl-tRNA(Ser) seleniumtransferase
VLDALGECDLPTPLITQVVRQHLHSLRQGETVPAFDEIIHNLKVELGKVARSRLQLVVNGTGIVLHTNFGRAPLSAAAVRHVAEIAAHYHNLEFDLASGGRGSRAVYLEHCLALACVSESATVVNNGAAALLLIGHHFTKRKREVIISRGELVQIGGGFRVGEMLAASGAQLREVGATNKTSIADYANAIGRETGLILRVHQSNFFLTGFTDSPPNDAIAALARARRVPFVVDLGSGAMGPTEALGLAEHEPTPAETLRQGAELVCFSGDKLMGGPQAGIIAGRQRSISALKREPMFRALRCDKMVFAALEATVESHLRKATNELPVLQLLSLPNEKLEARGRALLQQLRDLPGTLRLTNTKSEIGGGALPRSRPVGGPGNCFLKNRPNEIATALRENSPAVIGYVAQQRFKLDLRTIFPEEDGIVAAALRRCLTNPPD